VVAVKYTKAHRFELSYWAVARYGQYGQFWERSGKCMCVAAVVSSIQSSMQMEMYRGQVRDYTHQQSNEQTTIMPSQVRGCSI
jgi:hypothetical protein